MKLYHLAVLAVSQCAVFGQPPGFRQDATQLKQWQVLNWTNFSPALGEEAIASKLAIQSATQTIGGLDFPKVASDSGTCSCKPFDKRSLPTVARIQITGPYNDKAGRPTPPSIQEAVYSPPDTCWKISRYSRSVSSAAGSFMAQDDAQPANFKYLTATEYSAEVSVIKSYVASLNIPDVVKADLNAKVDDYVKNYSKYSNSIGTSHGQVRHIAQTYGLGEWSFKGRSWYDGYISTEEACVPAETRDAAALRKTLRNWVNSVSTRYLAVQKNKGELPK